MQHELIDGLRAAAVANVGLAIADVIVEQGVLADEQTMHGLVNEVDRELNGLGPLTSFVLPGVTDILVNGSREVWIDDTTGLHKTTLAFHDESSVRRLAVRLAAAAGRRLDAPAARPAEKSGPSASGWPASLYRRGFRRVRVPQGPSAGSR